MHGHLRVHSLRHREIIIAATPILLSAIDLKHHAQLVRVVVLLLLLQYGKQTHVWLPITVRHL